MSRLKKVAKATQALREIIGAELDDSNQGCCPMGDALREVAEIEAAIDALDEGYVDPAVCKQCQLVAPLTKALMKKPAIDEGWTDVPEGAGDYYVQGFEYNNEPTLCRLYVDEDGLWCKDVGYDLPYLVCDLSDGCKFFRITLPRPEGG